jgi:hypothetical protein
MDVPEYAGDLPCEEKDPDPTPTPSKTTPASTAKAAASRSTKLAKTGDEDMASAAPVALAGLTIVLCGLRKRRQA